MKRRALGAALAFVAIGCNASIPEPRFERSGNTDRAAPLGPGYVLMPIGTDDDSLLGRALSKAPEPGHALEEVAGPNPCDDKLGAATTVGMVSTLEDAEQLSASAKGRAALGVYGFSGEAKRATHFVYKLVTEKKAARDASADYVACCKQKSCGYGVVTELVYGDGEYSAAEETSGAASVDVVNIASARGTASLKLLHKRKVHGWIAAKVLIHPEKDVQEAKPKKELGAIGPSDVLLDVDSASAQIKELYEREKITVCAVGDGWAFCDVQVQFTERAFVTRYRELLNANDLDDLNTRRNTGWVVLGGGLTLVGVGLFVGFGLSLAAGVSDRSRAQDQCAAGGPCGGSNTSSAAPLVLGLGGLVATMGGAPLFIVTLTNPEGPVTSHRMTRADAERIAERYNRALLRRITGDVDQSRWDTKPKASVPVRWTPYLGLGGAGIVGTF